MMNSSRSSGVVEEQTNSEDIEHFYHFLDRPSVIYMTETEVVCEVHVVKCKLEVSLFFTSVYLGICLKWVPILTFGNRRIASIS